MKRVTEATILAHAKRLSKQLGLATLRVTLRQGAEVGWPDLIVLGPNRGALFMETKAPGRDATPIQKERARVICQYGHAYCKPDSKGAVEKALVSFAEYCLALGEK